MMIPWPIALLTLFYSALGAWAAATLWRAVGDGGMASTAWAMVWLAGAGAAAAGLFQLRAWGRRWALATSWLLIVATLATAGQLVARGHPLAGLVVTCSTAGHYLMIRYLHRPRVKAVFGTQHTADSGL